MNAQNLRVDIFLPSMQSSGITKISAGNIHEKRAEIPGSDKIYAKAIVLVDAKIFSIATGIHAVQRGIDKICQLRFWPDDDFVCWWLHNTRAFCIFTYLCTTLEHYQGNFHLGTA